MESFEGKKVLVVGLGRAGFSLINYFRKFNCQLRVTDIKPIFELNKVIKKLKKMNPTPEMTFGEHKDEDFLAADVIVYSSSVKSNLPQLDLARKNGKEVYGEFELGYRLAADKPIIAVCGSYGRTTVAHMIGFCIEKWKKKVFIGGSSEKPFIEYQMIEDKDNIDYLVIEVSAQQLRKLDYFKPHIVVFTNIEEKFSEDQFYSLSDFVETKLSVLKNLTASDFLVVNFDSLANNIFFRNVTAQTYWYSRKSFINLNVMNEVQGTYFHNKRIHSNINYHSQLRVNKMRIVGEKNRENLLAAITVAKILNIPDDVIQYTIENFPGIAHRLEYVIEKNGVQFYNDSKSENIKDMLKTVKAFKKPMILIAGGKESDQDYETCTKILSDHVRIMVLVGESKEHMNRSLGDAPLQTFLVGSFEESILFAYQKSRTGDVIVLSPGNPSTDIFRDYKERGNYYKKLIYQL